MIREPLRVAAFQRADKYERSGIATPVFATMATTGAPETVFFEMHESYASIEATDAVTNLGKLSDRAAPYATVLVHIPS